MGQHKIDRRRFLTAAGATLATPLVVSCASARRRLPPSEQTTIGIIGTGIRARNLMRGYLLKDERIRILAVCDVDRTRRDHYKGVVDTAYGNKDCAAIVDYREVLGRADIDAVVIATPDHWHVTQAVEAAKARKDVYCEKPLTHTLREGRLIVDAVRKHACVFQTGSQQRSEYRYRFVQAVELIRSGRLGRLMTVHVGVGDPPQACDLEGETLEPGLDWDRWLGPTPERPYHSVLSPRGVHRHYPAWRRYWDYCGGYLADMGAHHFDIAQWALDADQGGPVEARPPQEEDAKRGGILRYTDGVTVIHGGPSGATFIGTEGMIHVDRGRLSSTPAGILEKPLSDGDFRLPRKTSHVDDWLRCIRSRATPICSAEVGARSAAVCQLVNLAYRYRRPIAWDPEAWKFLDDEAPTEWMDYGRRAGYELPVA